MSCNCKDFKIDGISHRQVCDECKDQYIKKILMETNEKMLEAEINPKRGLRYNKGKIPLDMVPESLTEAVALTLQKGAEKYEKNNWRKGMSWETVYGCLQRHLQKWHDHRKSDIDEETGLNHLYLAACNVAFLIEYLESCPELDDRFKGVKDD